LSNTQGAGGKSEYAVSVPARKEAAPETKVQPISPEFHFPSWEGFQEASDWPSKQKSRFDRSGLFCQKGIGLKADREVVEESSCQLLSLRVP
jgi:hypothetical protein